MANRDELRAAQALLDQLGRLASVDTVLETVAEAAFRNAEVQRTGGFPDVAADWQRLGSELLGLDEEEDELQEEEEDEDEEWGDDEVDWRDEEDEEDF